MFQDGAGRNGSQESGRPDFTVLVAVGGGPFAAELGEFFRSEGCMVVEADSPAEAIDRTRASKPDLIVMDSRLAGGDGLALLADLLMEHPLSAVIVVAEEPAVPESVEAMRLGAVDYMGRTPDAARFRHVIAAQKALFRGGA